MRGWWAVLLAVLVLGLAGCIETPPSRPPARPEAPAQLAVLAFLPPDLVTGLGQTGYEPSLDIAPDGTLYATAARSIGPSQAQGLASFVWRSTDNGTTWIEMPSPGQAQTRIFGFEGDTAVDGQGRLYLADTNLADVALTRWSPGEPPVWDFTRPLASTSADDRPWIVAGGDGIVYYLGNGVAASMEPGTVAQGSLLSAAFHVHVSTDGGLTWDLGHALATGFSNLAIDPADATHALVFSYANPLVAFSTRDTGATWDRSEVAPAPPTYGMQFPAAAIDGAGTGYAAWVSGRPDTDGVDTLHVAVQGAEGWLVHDLPAPPSLAYVALAAAGEGRLAVAFQATNDTAPSAQSPWYAHVLVTGNATAPRPGWQAALLDQEPLCSCVDGRPDFFQLAWGSDGLHAIYGRAEPSNVPNQARITNTIWHARQAPA